VNAEPVRVDRVERFEDLIAWQKARQLVRLVYHVTKQRPFADDHGLASQLQRAAVSVMSNIAEGFERGGRNEFHQFLSTAKSSCGEARSLVYVAYDAEYIDHTTFEQLLASTNEVGRIVGGLRAAVARQRAQQQTPRNSA
jgi:four helix bundle protein